MALDNRINCSKGMFDLNALIGINMQKILILIIFSNLFFISTLSYSAVKPSGSKGPNGWETTGTRRVSLDEISDNTSNQGFSDIIEATARKHDVFQGSSLVLESVIQETVDRNKVGNVLLKRMLGGGLAIGGITALVEGVGWVMEDGVYVKHKANDGLGSPEPDPAYQYLYFVYKDGAPYYFPNANVGGDYLAKEFNQKYSPSEPSQTKYTVLAYTDTAQSVVVRIDYYNGYADSTHRDMHRQPNPLYDPNAEPKDKRIVLTPDLLGDLAVGDYTDPVDSSADKKDDIWTGVEDAYKHDPTGVGNEIADSIDNKHENNPTRSSKPRPVPPIGTGDPETTPSAPDDNAPPVYAPEDRPTPDGPGLKYPVSDGTQGTASPAPTDENGEPTGDATFKLPPFCSWATVVCEWIEWTYKDDLPEKEEIEIDEIQLEEKKVNVSWGAQCPEAQTIPFTLEGVTVDISILNPEYICAQAPILKPVIIFSATLTGLYILFGYGASRGKDE